MIADATFLSRNADPSVYSFNVYSAVPNPHVDMAGMPSYYVEGTLKNNSSKPIRSFTIVTSLYDCYNGDCLYIGKKRDFINVEIAPGDTYYWNKAIDLFGMKNMNRGLKPEFEVDSVEIDRF